jgi:hypothetical protein
LKFSWGFSKADLSAWLGIAVLLFLGWILVMPFVAVGPVARPLVIGISGLAFSAITAAMMIRAFRTGKGADEWRSTPTVSDIALFTYPLALRRLLRFGQVFWPVMLAVSVVGMLGGLGERSPMFLAETIVFGFFFILNLYVVARLVGEIRVSNHGLDVQMVSGYSTSIAWDEIVRLRISPRRDRFRLQANSGFIFSVESSLPGFSRLLRLIGERLEQRGDADRSQ